MATRRDLFKQQLDFCVAIGYGDAPELFGRPPDLSSRIAQDDVLTLCHWFADYDKSNADDLVGYASMLWLQMEAAVVVLIFRLDPDADTRRIIACTPESWMPEVKELEGSISGSPAGALEGR